MPLDCGRGGGGVAWGGAVASVPAGPELAAVEGSGAELTAEPVGAGSWLICVVDAWPVAAWPAESVVAVVALRLAAVSVWPWSWS